MRYTGSTRIEGSNPSRSARHWHTRGFPRVAVSLGEAARVVGAARRQRASDRADQSDGDELPLSGSLAGCLLESHHHPQVESVRDSQEGLEAGALPAAFDPGDLGVAGADAAGQLLLGQPMVHAVLDQEPGDLAVPALCLLSTPVCRTSRGPAAARLLSGAPDGAHWLLRYHALSLPQLVRKGHHRPAGGDDAYGQA